MNRHGCTPVPPVEMEHQSHLNRRHQWAAVSVHCTKSCRYSQKCSWGWENLSPETCRADLIRLINEEVVASCWLLTSLCLMNFQYSKVLMTHLFLPTQRQSFPAASALLLTFKLKWLSTLRKALHRSAVIQFNFLLLPLRQEIRTEERRGCGKKRRTREGQN